MDSSFKEMNFYKYILDKLKYDTKCYTESNTIFSHYFGIEYIISTRLENIRIWCFKINKFTTINLN